MPTSRRRWPMSKPKRTPIQYPSTFGGGILRPREVVESELDQLESSQPSPSLPADSSSLTTPAAPTDSLGEQEEESKEEREIGKEEGRKGGLEGNRKRGREDTSQPTSTLDDLVLLTKSGTRLYDLGVKPHRKDSFFFT